MKQNKLAVLGKEDCFSLTSPTTLTYFYLVGTETYVHEIELDRPVKDCDQVIADSKSSAILFCGDHCIYYAQFPSKLYGTPYEFGHEQLHIEEMGLRSVDAEVLMVKWHPRVPDVFLALFADGSLSVYNPCLQQSPLYSFSVQIDDFACTPISFAVGSEVGSDSVSLYISYSTGHIALACPVPIPNDSLSVRDFRTAWSENNPSLHAWLEQWRVVDQHGKGCESDQHSKDCESDKGGKDCESCEPRLVYCQDVRETTAVPLTVVYEPSSKQTLTSCTQFMFRRAAPLTPSQPITDTVISIIRFLNGSLCEVLLRDLADPLPASTTSVAPVTPVTPSLTPLAFVQLERFPFTQVLADVYPFSFVLSSAQQLYTPFIPVTRSIHCHFFGIPTLLETRKVEAPRLTVICEKKERMDGFECIENAFQGHCVLMKGESPSLQSAPFSLHPVQHTPITEPPQDHALYSKQLVELVETMNKYRSVNVFKEIVGQLNQLTYDDPQAHETVVSEALKQFELPRIESMVKVELALSDCSKQVEGGTKKALTEVTRLQNQVSSLHAVNEELRIQMVETRKSQDQLEKKMMRVMEKLVQQMTSIPFQEKRFDEEIKNSMAMLEETMRTREASAQICNEIEARQREKRTEEKTTGEERIDEYVDVLETIQTNLQKAVSFQKELKVLISKAEGAEQHSRILRAIQ